MVENHKEVGKVDEVAIIHLWKKFTKHLEGVVREIGTQPNSMTREEK